MRDEPDNERVLLTARLLKKNVLIPRIIALDPAKPLFSEENVFERISTGDAKHIEAIHTTTFLGFAKPLWNLDVYVNGGHNQPSCRYGRRDWMSAFSHTFSVDIMIRSIENVITAKRCHYYKSM